MRRATWWLSAMALLTLPSSGFALTPAQRARIGGAFLRVCAVDFPSLDVVDCAVEFFATLTRPQQKAKLVAQLQAERAAAVTRRDTASAQAAQIEAGAQAEIDALDAVGALLP